MPVRLTEIREALADRLATVDGLRAYATWLGGPPPSSSSQLSAAIVGPSVGEDNYVEYTLTGGPALANIRLAIRLVVQAVDLPSASRRMDDFLSSGTGATRSVIDAVHADRTLGGVVNECVIRSAGGVAVVTEEGAVPTLVAELDVEVYGRRD